MPEPKRTWGVLAYIVGDHEGLTPDQVTEIDDAATEEALKLVRAARGLDDVYLTVHVDLTHEAGSRIYRVPETEPMHKRRPGPPQPERRPEDRADLEALRKFIHEEKARRPSDYHMAVLWGHGGGPLGLFSDPNGGEPGTGQLRLPELSRLLPPSKSGRQENPLDILLVKSCYMATLEAAYQLQHIARFMICSQARVPMRTWTIWEDVFEQLSGEPDRVARAILDAIGRHYADAVERNGHDEVPFSLLTPAGLGAVKSQFSAFVDALKPYQDTDAVRAAIEDSRPGPGGEQALLDVRRLCANIANVPEETLANRAADVDDAIRRHVIVDSRPAPSAFGGVGLFHFPRNPLLRVDSFANDVTDADYGALRFPSETGWIDVALPNRTREAEPTNHGGDKVAPV